jgi:hypothetical protein
MKEEDRNHQTFAFDRSAFAIKSFEEASRTTEYWLSKTAVERFAAAWWLICHAWGLDHKEEHRLDRTFFSMRKQR